MRKAVLSIAAAAAVFALGLGGAAAQDNTANNNTNGSTVDQNNQGQTGTGTQLNSSVDFSLGNGTQIIATPSNVAVDSTTAQSPFSTAVGGDYNEVDGNSAGGNIYDVDGDAALGALGAVENGALANGGGIAFGENFNASEEFVAVGGDGVAAIAPEELADDGSALVIGDQNATAAADNQAAAVGNNGNAIVINDGVEDHNVIGFNNTVAQSELDQEYSAPLVAGPSADELFTGGTGAIAPGGPTFGLRDNDGSLVGSNQAFGTIETGNIGNINAADVAGINDAFFSTGVGNQGHIGSVSAGINTINLN